jgi:hypothetical protein
MIKSIVLRGIWTHRNNVAFKEIKHFSLIQLFVGIKFTIQFHLSGWYKHFKFKAKYLRAMNEIITDLENHYDITSIRSVQGFNNTMTTTIS